MRWKVCVCVCDQELAIHQTLCVNLCVLACVCLSVTVHKYVWKHLYFFVSCMCVCVCAQGPFVSDRQLAPSPCRSSHAEILEFLVRLIFNLACAPALAGNV